MLATAQVTNSALPQLTALTSMRGLAALWVLIHNDGLFREVSGIDDWTSFFAKGYLAVDFFLLLSGFILTYVHREQFVSAERHGQWKEYTRFLVLRLARIYPLYFFLLMVRVAIEFMKWRSGDTASFAGPAPFQEGNSLFALAANMLMVQAWGIFNDLTWIPTFWTVSAEWFAYLLFPVVLMLSGRQLSSLVGGIVASLVLLAVMAVATVTLGELEFPMRLSLLRCLPEFLLGVVLGLHWERWKDSSWLQSPWLVGALILLGIAHTHLGWHDLVAVLLLSGMLLAIAAADSRDPKETAPSASLWHVRFLRWRPLVQLGLWSYAIYLSHMIIQSGFRVAMSKFYPTEDPLLHFAGLGLKLGVTIFGSWLLYRWLELPVRNWIRTRFADAH